MLPAPISLRDVADTTLHRYARPAGHPTALHADIGSNYLDSLMLLRFRYKYRPGAIIETAKLMAYFDDLVLSDPSNETARRGLLLSMVTFAGLVPSALPDLLPQLLAHGGRPGEANPSAVEARIGAGMAAMFNSEYTLAEDMLSGAVDLAPDSAAAHVALGTLLLHIGRLHDSLRETRAGERLDPQSASNASMVSLALFSLRRFDEAGLQAQRSLSLDPQLLISRMLLADIEFFTADRAVALRQMASICSFCGDHPLALGKLAYAHGMDGDPAAARKVLDTLLSRSDQTGRAAPCIALGYLGLRDAKNALKWLRIASEQNSIVDIVPGSTPFFDPLRSDRKFHVLLPQCA
jgi:tetratricopeptide (TPR) repeat protein